MFLSGSSAASPLSFSAIFGEATRTHLQLLGAGASLLGRGITRIGFKTTLYPVGYWRFLPFGAVRALAAATHPQRTLDVSSPKALSLLLARDTMVVATDLDDPELGHRWKVMRDALGIPHLHFAFDDATSLSFPDNSFDLAYSISVIEHIPGMGDRAALVEFGRVVKPGGFVLVEVPLRHSAEELHMHYDSKGFALPAPRFYERRYDPVTLQSRLFDIPGLELVDVIALGERTRIDPLIATPNLPRLLRLAFLPFEGPLAAVNYFMSRDTTPQNPLAAMLLFRKH